MGQWRGKYLDTGPPRGPGHYSEDGRWWWDDGQDRWFRVTDQEDVLEVKAEDVGGISLAASLLTTLSGQYGNAYFRFVARARSADPRWAGGRPRGQLVVGHLPAAGPRLGHPARRLRNPRVCFQAARKASSPSARDLKGVDQHHPARVVGTRLLNAKHP
jgi:hypothetical protein